MKAIFVFIIVSVIAFSAYTFVIHEENYSSYSDCNLCFRDCIPEMCSNIDPEAKPAVVFCKSGEDVLNAPKTNAEIKVCDDKCKSKCERMGWMVL
jgi:hypothetical protein